MSVGNSDCRRLSSVCVLAPAYTSLCRGLEYLLKVRYIILVVLNGAGFLIFNTIFVTGWEYCPVSENNIIKMSGNCVWYHIFTKLLKYVYLTNKYIFIYQHATCDCMLWNAHWFYCVFLVFSYIIIDHSFLNCCISTKLSLIVLIKIHILICQYDSCYYKLWNAS